MLHDDKDNFLKILEATSAQTGFPLLLLEKDYYLTIVLSGMDRLSEELITTARYKLKKMNSYTR